MCVALCIAPNPPVYCNAVINLSKTLITNSAVFARAGIDRAIVDKATVDKHASLSTKYKIYKIIITLRKDLFPMK